MPAIHRTIAAVLCGLSGLSVILAMGAQFDEAAILAAGLGAMIGGALCAPLFGKPGHDGLVLAMIGAVLSTLLGSMLGGAALGLWAGPTWLGLIYGPLAVGFALWSSPAVLGAWIASMVAVHWTLGRLAEPCRPR